MLDYGDAIYANLSLLKKLDSIYHAAIQLVMNESSSNLYKLVGPPCTKREKFIAKALFRQIANLNLLSFIILL